MQLQMLLNAIAGPSVTHTPTSSASCGGSTLNGPTGQRSLCPTRSGTGGRSGEGCSMFDLSDITITGLCLDSRQVQPGDCFLAFPGLQVDGRDYIAAAVAAGAAAVLYEASNTGDINALVPVIAVEQLVAKISLLAGVFYDYPGEAMHIVGITGTNGKTSISHFLAQAYALLGESSAVMGTLGVGPLDRLAKTGMTTPDAITVQRALTQLRELDTRYLAMEVSSHALALHRVVGVPIKTAVYTQLSPDHLDFHRDMEDYALCKEKLFQFKSLEHGIINADDPWGRAWIERYQAQLPLVIYTLQPREYDLPTVRCVVYQPLAHGGGYCLQLSTPWGEGEVDLPLLGEYNIHNALAVVATLGAQGFSWAQIQSVLPQLHAVPGRLQWFHHPNGTALVVDFSHTPDALDNALQTLRPLCQGQLHCVFGCGGDRDSSKRPQMGAIAAKLADKIWITNDNPRSEDPQAIAQAIRTGCGEHAAVTIELDRKKAIQLALTAAGKHDMILVAGKGHETEQVIGDKTLHFSDMDCVRSLCKESK